MSETTRFQCCDCRVWLEPEYAQVVFGRQASGRVGRCVHCGKGLPAITGDQRYTFQKNGLDFTIMVAFEMARQVFAYVVVRASSGRSVGAFDLHELRAVIAAQQVVQPVAGISDGEIDTLKQELAAPDLWAKLVKA